MDSERRHSLPLSDEDIEKISESVARKARESFHINDEEHYNSHKRLDQLLEAYDGATNMFTKTFYGLVILGLILLAGAMATRGH
jgi:hypothetical protein